MKKTIISLIFATVLVPLIAAGVDFKPLDKPQYKLYTVCAGKIPNTSDEDLRLIAKNFEFYHGKFTTEQADAIRKINPAFKCLTYINSTYTRTEEDVRIVESKYREGLCMMLAANLQQSIDANCTKFSVAPYVNEKRKAKNQAEIAIRASTIEGDLSSNESEKPSTQFYVFWIRIGDELMRVNKFDAVTGEIEVTRGFSGSKPTLHNSGDKVFSPLYLGFERIKLNREDQLTMGGDKYPGFHPGGPGKFLRYVLDPCKETYQFQADIVLQLMQKDRVDGVWLDTFNCGVFNISDCLGRAARPWDFSKNQEYALDDFRLGQEKKITFIQKFIKEKLGKYPILVANNLNDDYEIGKGGMKLLLMPTEVKPRPLEAFCMEGGLAIQKVDKWKDRIKVLMDAAQNGLAAAPVWDNAGSPSFDAELDTPKRDKAERFGYASFLLGVEKNSKTLMGTYAFYQAEGKRFVKIHPMYYYPIGFPIETVKPESIDNYLIKDLPVYRRSFTKGLVLVNPSDKECEVKLDKSFLDPDTYQLVTSVIMAPSTGKILLTNPSGK